MKNKNDLITHAIIFIIVAAIVCYLFFTRNNVDGPVILTEPPATDTNVANAIDYEAQMNSLKIKADSFKSVAEREYNLRLKRDAELFKLRRLQAKYAAPDEAVKSFLSYTDSLFSGDAPKGIIRDRDTLYEIGVMNLRSANWLFVELEEERVMSSALEEYQLYLLQSYDSLSLAFDKSKLSFDQWQKAYSSEKNANALLRLDMAILNEKNKKIRKWAWIATAAAGIAVSSTLF